MVTGKVRKGGKDFLKEDGKQAEAKILRDSGNLSLKCLTVRKRIFDSLAKSGDRPGNLKTCPLTED